MPGTIVDSLAGPKKSDGTGKGDLANPSPQERLPMVLSEGSDYMSMSEGDREGDVSSVEGLPAAMSEDDLLQ